MARVEHLETSRVERLADTLAPALSERGQVAARITEVDDEQRWRRAAVVAGHRLGWHVRTTTAGPHDEWLLAYATDRPTTALERSEPGAVIDALLFRRPRPTLYDGAS